MADMVEPEQKLKAKQERTEWDRERIKANQMGEVRILKLITKM